MRRQLLRSAMLAVGAVVLVMGIPFVALVLWWARQPPDEVHSWVHEGSVWLLLAAALGTTAVLAGIGLGVGVLIAGRSARAVAEPLGALVTQAESLGAGEWRVEPLRSGISELDQISDVLARSAREVQHSLAAERDFASDASHQLRTPLTALLMRLEEIAASADTDLVRDEAEIAITQVERLTTVVDDLMGRARGHRTQRPQVSLDSVIASLQREYQPAFERARRSVHVQGQRGLVVEAAPVALSQMLSTLLENALAHGSGTVGVTARRTGPSVVVEVRDQGTGIDPALAPHIFERSVSSGSSGLGLALARDLAEKNGGRLELIRAQPATFAIFLSAAED